MPFSEITDFNCMNRKRNTDKHCGYSSELPVLNYVLHTFTAGS